jgi:hypothetical protein
MRTWGGFKAFTYSPSVSVSESVKDIPFRIMRRAAVCLGMIVLLCATPLFSQGKGEVPTSSSLPDPRFERLIVAKVGPWDITGAEFQLGYDFGPAFVKREKDSKKRYLNFLIYEKLLALDAQRRGLGNWPDLKRQVAEIEGDLATEELYKRDVLSKVHIGDRLLAVGVKDERVHLTLQWLFCFSAAEVDALVGKMKSGISFDSLYAQQIEGGAKPDARSMETTRFKVRMNNPLFASIVDTMKDNAISLPIHGPDGWYIVKMADEWIDPVVTQTDETKLVEDVRRAFIQQISDSLSDVYVRGVVSSQHPTILRGPFNAIQAYLGNKFLSKDTVQQWQLNSREGAKELKDGSDLKPLSAKTLVSLRSKNLTVGDFLDWYRMREPYIKLELATPQGFFQSAEGLVWRMVRDRLLTRKAFAKKLQNSPNVKRRTQWWKEKMLYTANKNRIADTITDSLPLIREYYEANTRSFVDEKGKIKPFGTVQEDAWRQYYSSELTKRLLHEILRLKRQYGIKIDQSALDRIPVDEQNNPKAIEVYTAKTGGIYPHVAFPSIDYDWQSWE